MFNLFGEYGSIYPVGNKTFPDGTLHLELPNDDIRAVEWKYENDAELFTLICIRRHYAEQNMILIMPYIPHARMDRVKESYDVFTLKYFAEIINSLNFDEVRVLDAHSNVSLALLERVVQTPVKEIIEETLQRLKTDIFHSKNYTSYEEMEDDLVFFFPDEGSMKRYSDMFKMPYTFGVKKRDWATGKIQGLQLMNPEMVKDKNILIIDDICSRGGTFYHSAKALKEAGAKDIYLYVSHAENTMVQGEMYNNDTLIKKIYTTDSLFNSELDTKSKVNIIQM